MLQHLTRDNRLLSYQVFDTSSGSDVLLRTVTYTYYQSGWASNITIADAYVDAATTPGDPGDYDWRQDLALYYYKNGMLRLALWGKYKLDAGGAPDANTYATPGTRELRYESAGARYLAVDYTTPGPNPRICKMMVRVESEMV